jgi:hypothetical protein
MSKVKERRRLADWTKDVKGKTRKFTYGAAFYNDIVALNLDRI